MTTMSLEYSHGDASRMISAGQQSEDFHFVDASLDSSTSCGGLLDIIKEEEHEDDELSLDSSKQQSIIALEDSWMSNTSSLLGPMHHEDDDEEEPLSSSEERNHTDLPHESSFYSTSWKDNELVSSPNYSLPSEQSHEQQQQQQQDDDDESESSYHSSLGVDALVEYILREGTGESNETTSIMPEYEPLEHAIIPLTPNTTASQPQWRHPKCVSSQAQYNWNNNNDDDDDEEEAFSSTSSLSTLVMDVSFRRSSESPKKRRRIIVILLLLFGWMTGVALLYRQKQLRDAKALRDEANRRRRAKEIQRPLWLLLEEL